MPLVTEPVRCPPIASGTWLGGAPVQLSAGRLVLVDFWDYTCVNCLNTLPYLRAWRERYGGPAFEIVGVHAPEFGFAREPGRVERAMRDLGITWPVAIDNDYQIWSAYAVRAWPTEFLVDGRGYLRYEHTGEGAYADTEAAIRSLLIERDPALTLPPPLPPLRERDAPGAVCRRPTPELYLGWRRGRFGLRDEELGRGERWVYHAPPAGGRALHHAYLDGAWTLHDEAAEAATTGATLSVQFEAAEVNAVLAPPEDGRAVFAVELDGAPLPPPCWGSDMATDGETGAPVVTVTQSRMYRLIAGNAFIAGELTLRAATPGGSTYALSFIGCVEAHG